MAVYSVSGSPLAIFVGDAMPQKQSIYTEAWFSGVDWKPVNGVYMIHESGGLFGARILGRGLNPILSGMTGRKSSEYPFKFEAQNTFSLIMAAIDNFQADGLEWKCEIQLRSNMVSVHHDMVA